jgi:hypothetical protein
MKVKVTKKQVQENYKNIISVGYCDLQYLLRFKEPSYYTAGVYGWNADIYQVNYNTCIVTGYRPFGNISNYELVREVEKIASDILDNRALSLEEQKAQIDFVFANFISKIVSKN